MCRLPAGAGWHSGNTLLAAGAEAELVRHADGRGRRDGGRHVGVLPRWLWSGPATGVDICRPLPFDFGVHRAVFCPKKLRKMKSIISSQHCTYGESSQHC